jgi:hypothetical protein
MGIFQRGVMPTVTDSDLIAIGQLIKQLVQDTQVMLPKRLK